jgi:group II intron reverse transcriptase/maturase
MNNQKTKKPPIVMDLAHYRSWVSQSKSDTIRRYNYLGVHTIKNKDTSHINYKIHHILHNPNTFISAYVAISKNKGALTKGVKDDEEVNKFFGKINAQSIADQFKTNSYQFKSLRRTWIPKPGKTAMRPLDTPTQQETQQDRVVQEAIRGILEAIYEPEFREFAEKSKLLVNNYGFRPNLSTWQAVERFQEAAQGTSIVIEGDISKAYNTINHNKLISLLSRRIKDKKFIDLINNLLKCGVMDGKDYEHSLEGTPQGGIVSPLLFNIYMFEFDKYVFDTIISPITLNKPKLQKDKAYQNVGHRMRTALTSWQKSSKDKKSDDIRHLRLFRESQLERLKMHSNKLTSLPKKAIFVRYADDWVLAFTGTHGEAQLIKDRIRDWLKEELSLSLSEEKTSITKIQQGIKFLGFEIIMRSNRSTKITRLSEQNSKTKEYNRFLRRTTSRKINILPDKYRLLSRLVLGKFCTEKTYFPIGIRSWAQFDEYEIVLKYRRIMVGLTNYYRNCDNVYFLNRVSYILQYSCAKTISVRQKSSISKVFNKYGKDLTIVRQYKTAEKTHTRTTSFPTLATLRTEGRLEYLNKIKTS